MDLANHPLRNDIEEVNFHIQKKGMLIDMYLKNFFDVNLDNIRK